MSLIAERGFLVLADISGFTAFVAGTELEHAPPIIAALLETVIRQLAPPLEVQEVEGDAISISRSWRTTARSCGRRSAVDVRLPAPTSSWRIGC